MVFDDLIQYLHEIAPNQLQETYDNAGLIVGDAKTPITGVLVSLDATEKVIDEAIALGCNLVVSHHPIVFTGLKRFTGATYVERAVIKAIKHDIGLFAIHTNLDNVLDNGVNQRIAHQLGLEDLDILSPKPDVLYNEKKVGAGVIGRLASPMSSMDFLHYLKNRMELSTIKYTDLCKSHIEKVAICGGSGGFLLAAAKASEADIFITSDYKYHEFFDADGAIIIADIGHYESEQFTIQLLQELISQKFSNFAAHCTKIITNPVHYL